MARSILFSIYLCWRLLTVSRALCLLLWAKLHLAQSVCSFHSPSLSLSVSLFTAVPQQSEILQGAGSLRIRVSICFTLSVSCEEAFLLCVPCLTEWMWRCDGRRWTCGRTIGIWKRATTMCLEGWWSKYLQADNQLCLLFPWSLL